MPRKINSRTRVRMSLRIGKPKGRTPGAAENLPFVDAEMLADTLHIGDQIPRRILVQFRMWCRFPTTALIEKDDAIALGIVQTPHRRIDPTPWTAVNHDHRFTVRIAAFLHMNAMQFRYLKHLFQIRLGLRVKSICNHASHFQ